MRIANTVSPKKYFPWKNGLKMVEEALPAESIFGVNRAANAVSFKSGCGRFRQRKLLPQNLADNRPGNPHSSPKIFNLAFGQKTRFVIGVQSPHFSRYTNLQIARLKRFRGFDNGKRFFHAAPGNFGNGNTVYQRFSGNGIGGTSRVSGRNQRKPYGLFSGSFAHSMALYRKKILCQYIKNDYRA